MDENEAEVRSPIKRLGSTRKLIFVNNIRLQLNEQLRCLDVRMEAQVAVLTEIQDFFRRRGELELDYSKNLDKLAKTLHFRHKEQKQKREQWPLFSSYTCWQQLVAQTKNLSRDHAALSEVYSNHLVARLSQVMEDVQRIYKRCREIGYETHEEILRVLHELHTTMKTYHSYQAELRQADTKLRTAELQRSKLEQSFSQDKLERSKKYKLMEKEVTKRRNKYTDVKLKALKAKNEYLLCLEAANTTIHKYFVDDLSDLIDCMDFGFHNCISRALMMHITAEEGRQKSVQSDLDSLSACINSLDSRLDKQKFLENNHAAFMIPKKLEFQRQKTDESPEPAIQSILHREMETRLTQLQQRVTSLRAESEEVWKTLETAESTLLEMLCAKDYDCSGYFGDNAVPASKPPETVSIKLRADRQETEEFYLIKFREYLLGSTKIARLDAKQEFLRQSLLAEAPDFCNSIKPVIKTPKRKRIGRLQMSGQPKLFGGSIEEYQEATNQEIPLIMRSCIRVINLYGLHHQGIFRVSGSQVEINNFREWFERGEDPLADMTDASDINSVAGVLKLYLRELREPLFPIIYFEQFMEIAQLESKQDFVVRMRELMCSLPRSVVVVLRYLFAFLNHLSEFSDENMMDPYNLAICFGPTLVPVPEDKDQVQYQNQVNELIKNIILFNDDIFPNDGGTVYEKYISPNSEDHDVGDSPDQAQEDMDSEVYPSEDDSENIEATAQFDFIARSDRELSLKRGDSVTLYSQVSNDWWRGTVNGQEGLIPDKYISLKIKDDDRDKVGLKSSSSEESVQRRTLNSKDSMLCDYSSISSSNNSPVVQYSPVTWNKVSDLAESIENATVLLNQAREPTVLPKNEPSDDAKTTETPKDSEKPPATHKTQEDISKAEQEKPQAQPQPQAEIDESNVNFSENRELWQRRAILESTLLGSPILKTHRLSEPHIQRHSHTPDLVMDLPMLASVASKEQLTKSALTLATTTDVASDKEKDKETKATEGTSAIALDPCPDASADKDKNNENDKTLDKNKDNDKQRKIKAVEGSSGADSPDMQTAAETFAKQNQCTLKKNKKNHVTETDEYVTITSPMTERKYATLEPNMTMTSTFKPAGESKPMVLKKPVFSMPLRSVSIEMMCKDPPDLPT
ncbi:SLIT-ROBO Rho GTPase-activating protein 1-like isoform X1 [Diabrotica virgifera virgifera]|uniref:SLIT-ROBO Rho GTPase-activating protein 1-like n=1 Tax=Diabrotica virgifera virgifera TaxID=50390 RepID=A0ABM5JHW9_DIAVI|nr:SLIT-ROBO Rho GTPase-activating protein 1-like isoform X1 [Diabrotica virgifera virgifera]